MEEPVNLCAPATKKKVATSLGVKDPNTLNNYVKRLKDKGAIQKTDSGYRLSGLLYSQEGVIITIQDERSSD